MSNYVSSLLSVLPQVFPGQPHYTEHDIPDLTNKVTIVTGSNTGVGKEVARILYSKNARVYMLARSREKTLAAIDDIQRQIPSSKGKLEYIRLDLADLSTIRQTCDEFLSKEDELHVLFNNAGVGFPEFGSTTKQGYELQIGVNCLGPLALTELLTPTLERTAAASPAPGAVRVVWTSSSAAESSHPDKYMSTIHSIAKNPRAVPTFPSYAASKLGNFLHAAEYARRHTVVTSHGEKGGDKTVLSVSLNPGNLDSDLWRTMSGPFTWFLRTFFFYPSVNGAYTTLFAGFSPEVDKKTTGSFIAPWGRLWQTSNGLAHAAKPKAEGGSGAAAQFYDWSIEQIRPYIS